MRRPRSKSDRLPVQYPGSKPQQYQMSPSSDFDAGAVLALPTLTPEEREERNRAAVRYLTSRGADDLLDVLGLAAPRARAGVGLLAVACPECQEPAGTACAARTGGRYHRGHVSRHRLAGEAA